MTMARRTMTRPGGEAALLLALVMVVQALFGGLALAAHADTAAARLRILCSSGRAVHADLPAPGGAPASFSGCCTLGCPLQGGFMPPAATRLPLPAAPAMRADWPAGERASIRRAELMPLNSRAPPRS